MGNIRKPHGGGDRRTGQTIRGALKGILGKKVPGALKPAGGSKKPKRPKKK